MEIPRRAPTEYNQFVRRQMRQRPADVSGREWMREIGRRWRNRGAANLLDDQDEPGAKDCLICYEGRPLTDYHDGRCQHHADICRRCCARMTECPFCRANWQATPPRRHRHNHHDHRPPRPNYLALLNEVATMLGVLARRIDDHLRDVL